MKKASWFVILLFAISCLDDPDCFQLNNNIIGITFKVLGSTKADTLIVLSVHMSGTDSVFLTQPAKRTFLELPLNFKESSTAIQLNQLGGIINSMNLGYLSQTQFVSEDCGSRYILSRLEVIGHDFDSVRLVNPNPDKVAQNNIEVYRCPDPIYLTVVFRDLYLSAGKEAKRTGAIKLSGINISNSGDVYYEDANLATFYLPVDTLNDQTSFEFVQPDGTSSTLTMSYVRAYQKRYNPCTPQTFISNLSIVDSAFVRSEMVLDAEGVKKSTITDPPEANVYVYRCPRTNLMKIDFRQRVSGTSSSVKSDTVFLKSVTANYTSQIFYTNTPATTITVPLDETQSVTDFYLEYQTETETKKDTLKLSYLPNPPQTFITDCGPQGIYSDLTLLENVTGVTVKSDSLRFPTVSNIEILN